MSGPWHNDDPAGTIRLDESDIVEMESAADLFAPFPDEVRATPVDTVRGTPSQLAQESPTREARMWDLSPQAAQHAAQHHDDSPTNGRARTPYREVTAVRERAGGDKREWIDMHAVVDDEGRLRLPEDVAKALQSGAIVEVRLAAWAVKDT